MKSINFFAAVLNGFIMLAAGLFTGCSSGKSTGDIPAVDNFDLDRYSGAWYEIARLPHRFERGLDFVSADYSLRDDGRIKVVNSGVKNGKPTSVTGVAEFKGNRNTGELRVSFFRPFYGDYRIILLEKDYSAALVTSGTADYFWILARQKELPAEKLKSYLDFARKHGFEVDKLEYPKQK